MLLTILGSEHIWLDTGGEDEGLAVEGENFGPVQMLAASLALCTASVIHSYGENARLDLTGLAIEIQWEFAEDPRRVGSYHITLHVPPGISEARHRAIVRAADTCTVHTTLSHPPKFATVVQTADPDHLAHHHHQRHHHHHHHEHVEHEHGEQA